MIQLLPDLHRPCVIYAHCNSGSRRDAEEALYVLLPHNITVFCLDFAVRLPLSITMCSLPYAGKGHRSGQRTARGRMWQTFVL